tara:strand:+ start:189 stop:893 length:705 start_codon:yes stop_codon:yes gene_type:complete
LINKLIFSPPFSNIYPNIKNTTKIVGTYTLQKRKGMYRILTTLKKTELGWTNNVGLRNPGIDKCKNKNNIVSISEINNGEFDLILEKLSELDKILGIEFNISCPNEKISNINLELIKKAKKISNNIIIKFPHKVREKKLFDLIELEDFIVHISNTKKLNNCALSGKELVNNNLNLIYNLKKRYPDRKVIAGGGIYDIDTLLDYKDVGADFFSLSTILINPYKTHKIIRDFKKLF